MNKIGKCLLAWTFLTVCAVGHAQQVSVAYRGQTVEQVITDLKAKTGYDFVYQKQVLNDVPPITVRYSGKNLPELFGRVFASTGLEFEIVKNTVILRKGSAPKAQSVKPLVVSGTVYDATGLPLPGASVQIEGTRRGFVTDADGNFSFETPAGKPLSLRVSFVGMKSATRAFRARADEHFSITLKDDRAQMQEVVVNGMFTRRAQSFTGSAVAFKKDDLRAVGNTNVLQSLKNLDPSFRFADNLSVGSDPNALPDISLRGQSGFPDLKGEYSTNPNQPLFIVDGFETTLTKVMDMDMNRIASVTLLKDAAAKAIYGSKAANGVVVIETTKPDQGDLRVSYTGSVNFNVADLSSYDLCNAAEKLQVEKNAGLYDYKGYNGVEYWESAVGQYDYNQKYNSTLRSVLEGVNTDWKYQPVRNAVGHKHTLYIEGGSQAFQYGVDLAYNDVEGVMKGSGRETITGGLTFSYRYKKFLLRDNLEVSYNNSKNSPYGNYSSYTRMNPYFRPYDDNGNLIKSYTREDGTTVANPMWNAFIKTKDLSKYTQFTNNFYAEYRLTQDLKFIGRLGITRQENKTEVFHPASHTDFIGYEKDEDLIKRRGTYAYTDGSYYTLSADISASYSKNFAEKHLVFANLAWNVSETSEESMSMKAEGFPNDQLSSIGYARAYYKDSAPTSVKNTTRDAGAVAAANYSYDERYLLDASFRLSGSSQFGSKNRWGKFWALGAGWNIHNEAFMKNVKWVNQLKLRASLGFTGSQNFNSYQSLATWSYYTSTFYDGEAGAYLLAMANDKLKWQRKMDGNVGLDLNLFDNRLNMRLDYYNATTDDLLTDVTIPSSTGFTTYKENLGKVQNLGYEIYASYRVYENKQRHDYVNFYANVVHNSNKIKEISNSLESYNKQQSTTVSTKPVTRYEEGQSMTAIWAVPSMGIDPATGKEVYVKKDGTTTFTWDSDDLAICGDTQAKIYGNCGINAYFRGFTLNLGMTYKFGGQLYNQTLVDKVENADLNYNVDRRVFSDRWQKTGDVSRFKDVANTSTTRATQRFVEDNNVWTFSSLNIGYDFDKFRAVKNLGFSRLRLSFDMADIAQVSSIKIERGTSYPFSRSFSFSLQAIF